VEPVADGVIDGARRRRNHSEFMPMRCPSTARAFRISLPNVSGTSVADHAGRIGCRGATRCVYCCVAA